MKAPFRNILFIATLALALPAAALSQFSSAGGGNWGSGWQFETPDPMINSATGTAQPETPAPEPHSATAGQENGARSGQTGYEVAPETGTVSGERGSRTGTAVYPPTQTGTVAYKAADQSGTYGYQQAPTLGGGLGYTPPPGYIYSSGEWGSMAYPSSSSGTVFTPYR